MKKRTYFLLAEFLFACTLPVAAQWVPAGNAITNPAEYLGHDASSNQPLRLKTILNDPIYLYTGGINRMRLMDTITTGVINGYNNLNLTGHLGVGLFTDPQVDTPYTYLHINHNGTEESGYRSWMKTGLYITDRSDMMYFGTKPRDGFADRNDAVINWSDNLEAGGNGPDILQFIFTRDNSGGNAASLLDGLELARIVPDPNGNEGYFGIGDWFTAAVRPSERLDILDQTIRIRRLIPDYLNDTLSRAVVVDGTGRLHWRHFPVAPVDCKWTMSNTSPNHVLTAFGTTSATCPDDAESVGIGFDPAYEAIAAKLEVKTDDLDIGARIQNAKSTTSTTSLRVIGSGGTTETNGVHVTSTQASSGAANNYAVRVLAAGGGGTGGNVGVDVTATNSGTSGASQTAGFRAYVADNATNADNYGFDTDVVGVGSGTYNRGADLWVYGGTGSAGGFGVRSEIIGGGTGATIHGVFGKAYVNQDGATSYGVLGQALGNGSTEYNYGVMGYAASGIRNYGVYGEGYQTDTNKYAYGVYGRAPTTGSRWWAVYSEGDQFSTTSGTWTTSDAMLKQNIEPLENGLDRILQLQPKTYQFRTGEYDYLSLAHGPQFGLIAQEAREVVPELTRLITRPEDRDSLGNVVHPEMELLTLNYEGLIPLLVAAVKEQQATIAEQSVRLDEMEEALSNCCADMTGGGERSVIQTASDLVTGNERALTIQPNPFNERTTLYYTLERGGRIQLLVNSADGKQLRVLQEANLEAGQYQHEWQTSELTPGVYYVTLLLDGEPIVKKAVKVQR